MAPMPSPTQTHSFRNLMLLPGITGSPGLIFYLPCPSPGVNHFFKVPGFHWRMPTLFLGVSKVTGWHGTSLLISPWIPDFNMCPVGFVLLRVRKSRVSTCVSTFYQPNYSFLSSLWLGVFVEKAPLRQSAIFGGKWARENLLLFTDS